MNPEPEFLAASGAASHLLAVGFTCLRVVEEQQHIFRIFPPELGLVLVLTLAIEYGHGSLSHRLLGRDIVT